MENEMTPDHSHNFIDNQCECGAEVGFTIGGLWDGSQCPNCSNQPTWCEECMKRDDRKLGN